MTALKRAPRHRAAHGRSPQCAPSSRKLPLRRLDPYPRDPDHPLNLTLEPARELLDPPALEAKLSRVAQTRTESVKRLPTSAQVDADRPVQGLLALHEPTPKARSVR